MNNPYSIPALQVNFGIDSEPLVDTAEIFLGQVEGLYDPTRIYVTKDIITDKDIEAFFIANSAELWDKKINCDYYRQLFFMNTGSLINLEIVGSEEEFVANTGWQLVEAARSLGGKYSYTGKFNHDLLVVLGAVDVEVRNQIGDDYSFHVDKNSGTYSQSIPILFPGKDPMRHMAGQIDPEEFFLLHSSTLL